MAGFNDTDAKRPNTLSFGKKTNAQSPGGLFQTGSADVSVARSANAAADDAKKYAELAKKYAEDADSDRIIADSDAKAASASADSAAASATAAANSATEADEQADRAKSWAVGPSGANEDGTDTDNAHYWSQQAATHDSEYRQYVKDAQGWAHGDTDSPLGGWTDTDNSKYWSEQSEASEAAAAASAAAAKSDSESAASNAASAATSATNSANSATASANSAADSAASAAQSDSDAQDAAASATAAANSATKADSDATRADSDAKAAAASAVEAQGWAIDTEAGSHDYSQNSAKWWAEQAESHANSVKDDTEGLGIFIDDSGTKQSFAVDTEIIADTDWVKEHVSGHGGNVTWEDQRSDSEFTAMTFEVNSDTGLEVVMVGSKAVLREYVPTPDFAISISGGQGNASWFMADTEGEVSISASHGTLSSITSANVGGSSTDVTIDNDNNTITYPVSNSNGLYTLNVNASGTNADGDSQTDSASHSWRIYADYWLSINQASASASFNNTAGRSTNRFSTGNITAQGYTFLTVSQTEFPNKFQFRTSLGGLDVQDPTTITVTIDGVSKQYSRYYLGNFSHETTITVSEGG